MSKFKVGDKVYFCYVPWKHIIKASIDFIENNRIGVHYIGNVINQSTRRLEEQTIYDVLSISDVYHTKREAKKALKREFYDKVNEVKKNIYTLEDLLKFMYNNDLVDWSSASINDWQTDWVSRVAVRELAKELLGIELGE